MELAFASFMTTIGFTMAEILKMLVLVGLNFLFMLVIMWRARKPIVALYQSIMTAMASIPEMKTSIANLNVTLQEQIVQTSLRMESGDVRFMKIEDRLTALEKDKQTTTQGG